LNNKNSKYNLIRIKIIIDNFVMKKLNTNSLLNFFFYYNKYKLNVEFTGFSLLVFLDILHFNTLHNDPIIVKQYE